MIIGHLKWHISNNWRKANVSPIFQEVQKNKTESYGLVSLALVLRKVMEQVFLNGIYGHMKEKVSGNSQHGFIKGQLCLTYLIAFCDRRAGFVDKGRTIFPDYSNLFNTICNNILIWYKFGCYCLCVGTPTR